MSVAAGTSGPAPSASTATPAPPPTSFATSTTSPGRSAIPPSTSSTTTHVIEHVADVIRTMEEFHRLVRPGGRVHIVTPHYTDFSSFCDPTHRWHLNSYSFRYFGADDAGFGYYSGARFRERKVRLRLLAFWRWLGFEWLVNAFPRFRLFWEPLPLLRRARQGHRVRVRSRQAGNGCC
jgi:SAM-dependent methyltransferase